MVQKMGKNILIYKSVHSYMHLGKNNQMCINKYDPPPFAFGTCICIGFTYMHNANTLICQNIMSTFTLFFFSAPYFDHH